MSYLVAARQAVAACALAALLSPCTSIGGAAKGPEAVESLLKALKDSDPKAARDAFFALRNLRDPLATEHVIPLITAERTRPRLEAAWILQAIGDPRGADALAETLVLGMCDHCTGAGYELAAMGGWGTEALLKALDRCKDSRARAHLLSVLGKMDDPRAAKALFGLLSDPDPAVRNAADRALDEAPTPQEPKTLKVYVDALLAGDAPARRRAARSLVRCGAQQALDPLLAALRDIDAEVRSNAAGSLGRLKDRRAVVSLLTTLRDSEAAVRRSAAYALGDLGDIRAADDLTAALSDPDISVRCSAAYALGRASDRRSIEPLRSLLHDKSEGVRRAAAGALEAINSSPAGPRSEPEPAAVPPAAKPVPAPKPIDPRRLQELIAALDGREALARRMAAIALGETKDERAIAPLMNALNDPDYDVRRAAVDALRILKGGSPRR